MPATVKIDPQRRIVSSTFYGTVTDGDLLAHQGAIAREPNFNPDFAEIVDFTDANVTFTKNSLTALAGHKSLFSPSVPHVVIAPSEDFYRLAMEYKQLARSSRPTLHVVRSIAEAKTLLASLGYQF